MGSAGIYRLNGKDKRPIFLRFHQNGIVYWFLSTPWMININRCLMPDDNPFKRYQLMRMHEKMRAKDVRLTIQPWEFN